MEKLRKQRNDFNQVYGEWEGIYHQISQKAGISEISYRILYMVCESEFSWSQIDICRFWNYPKQSVNSAVTKLVKDEYVFLIQDKTAKNRKVIKLTKKGIEFCNKWICPVIIADLNSFASLSEEERDLYINFMKRMCDNFKVNLKDIL